MPTVPHLRVLFTLTALASALAATAHAAPVELAVQGVLWAAGGGPVADGTYPVAVALYAGKDDVKPLVIEKFLAVPVTGGIFHLVLGTPAGGDMLDEAQFVNGKAKWFGIQVAADPELPRVPLQAVPYAVMARGATKAFGLECSGCVDADDLAAGAVTGDKVAANAIDAKHVAFTFAGSKSKGGPADSALAADVAKLAEFAKLAELAKQAESAATADEAKTAAKLQCTGCVTAAMVAPGFAAGLVVGKQLALVATSGKYADLDGGPDLSGYGKLADANKWVKTQAFGDGIDLGGSQASGFRFQNADKEPVPCGPATAGFAWFDTTASALKVCNGKAYFPVNLKQPVGTTDEPGKHCKHIREENGPGAASGLYWIKNGAGKLVEVYCDMATDGGGWTRVFSIALGSGCTNMTAGAHGDPKSLTATCDKFSDAFINELATEKIFFSRVGGKAPLFTKWENAVTVAGNPGKVVNAETYAAVKAAAFVKVPGYGGWRLFHQHDWYQPDTCVGSKASSLRLSLEYLTDGGPKYTCSGSCGDCGTNTNSGIAEVYVR